jgi:hypothetical protein
VARMARFGVRSRAVAFARPSRDPVTKPFERTGANGREHRSHLPCRRSWVRVPSSALKFLQIGLCRRQVGKRWLQRGCIRARIEPDLVRVSIHARSWTRCERRTRATDYLQVRRFSPSSRSDHRASSRARGDLLQSSQIHAEGHPRLGRENRRRLRSRQSSRCAGRVVLLPQTLGERPLMFRGARFMAPASRASALAAQRTNLIFMKAGSVCRDCAGSPRRRPALRRRGSAPVETLAAEIQSRVSFAGRRGGAIRQRVPIGRQLRLRCSKGPQAVRGCRRQYASRDRRGQAAAASSS